MVKEVKNDLPLLVKVRLGIYVILCAGMVIAMGALLVHQHRLEQERQRSFHFISKDEWNCSRTVSTGKGLDQVGCVQFTHERIWTQVVEPPPGLRPQGTAVAPTPQPVAPKPQTK